MAALSLFVAGEKHSRDRPAAKDRIAPELHDVRLSITGHRCLPTAMMSATAASAFRSGRALAG
jgi:hypothetical protein